MSGSTIISPNDEDINDLVDNTSGLITAALIRQLNDSLAGCVCNPQSGTTYTFLATDRGKMVEGTATAAAIWTIPANFLPVYAMILWRQIGSFQITFAPGTGVSPLRTATSLTSRSINAAGGIHQRALNDWVVYGDLV